MSWLFSRALVAAFSGGSSWDGEPCALLNLTPSLRPFLLSDKTTAFSSLSQFGVTCRHLTELHGGELLTLYLVVSHARTSVPPGRVREYKAPDRGFGSRWPGSFARYNPDTCSWRTPQHSLHGGLMSYSEPWPKWGSMRDGECSELATPGLRTSAKDSGSWPTIRSTDGERGGRGDLIQAIRGNPNSHYRMWPTPKASAAGPDFAKLTRSKTGISLQTAVAIENPSGGGLNPPWVEWLMGWPMGWTDCAPLATDKYQQWLRSHGGC